MNIVACRLVKTGRPARSVRAYTQGERSRLRVVFGDTIDYERVAIRCGPGRNPIAAVAFANRTPAITLGSTIYMRPDVYRDDFSADMVLLAHETTHIWQYVNTLPGGFIGPGLIACQSLFKGGTDKAYDISGVHLGSRFNGLGFEQQAVVVESYFAAMRKRNDQRLSLCGQVLKSARPSLLEASLRGEQNI